MRITCHDITYFRSGSCKRCGACEKKECVHFSWQDGLATCFIQETKEGCCRDFPDHPGLRVIRSGECGYKFEPVTPEDAVKFKRLYGK